jgi:phosphohistidine phosphatase
MTLRLILTRHAKSSWGDPMMDDHDRPLNKRGRASAKAVGDWLAAGGYVPDQVMVSTAERTRETWKLIARKLPGAAAPTFLAQLYHAEPDGMLHLLRTATGKSVMMVGHNPGMAYFAQGLVHRPPADSRFERYPTGATTVIEFDCDGWSKLAWRTGTVVSFVAARDLLKQK